MNRTVLIFTAVVISGLALAQQKAKTVPAVAPETVIETSYTLPLEMRDKFRDLQHEYDAIEIENQKMLLKIEQNKARQAALVDQEMSIASEFGRMKNLDLSQYELDPAPIVLRKKGKK